MAWEAITLYKSKMDSWDFGASERETRTLAVLQTALSLFKVASHPGERRAATARQAAACGARDKAMLGSGRLEIGTLEWACDGRLFGR